MRLSVVDTAVVSDELLFERHPRAMWVYDLETLRFVAVNDAAVATYGYDRAQFLALSLADLHPEHELGEWEQRVARVRDTGLHHVARWRHRTADGSTLDVETESMPFVHRGRPARLVMVSLAHEAARRERDSLLGLVLDRLPCVTWTTDTDLRLTSIGGAGLEALGVTSDAIGLSAEAVVGVHIGADGRDAAWAHIRALAGERVSFEGRWGERWVEAVTEPLIDGNGDAVGVIGVALDVTERRREREELAFLARHDVLTGLPNRASLVDDLERAIARGRRHVRPGAVLFLDLDRFKWVNDTYGHVVGDELLVAVAERLRRTVRVTDFVARHGGDEFVVVLEDIRDADAAAESAARILDAFAPRFALSIGAQYVVPSIGLALFPHDGETPHDLLRAADAAMYRAKARGGGVEFYTPELHSAARRQLEFANGLRSAIQEGLVYPAFQTIHAADSGRIIAVEALARCEIPGFEDVPVQEMIRVAEVTGTIGALGEMMLRKAVRQVKQWDEEGIAPETLAVNVSPRQLTERQFPRRIAEVLIEECFPANRLELEITESALIDGTDEVLTVISQIRQLGVRFAIDDFGTGFSSLAYFKRIPSDTIKIDKSFVEQLDGTDRAIVEGVVTLAHALGKRVVAEGVETVERRDGLRSLGCDALQGWYYARAETAELVGRRLRVSA